MFSALLPKNSLFFDYFDQHAKITLQAAQAFLQFALTGEIPFKNGVNPIKQLEHCADEVTHHCIESLHKSFITPLQQDDIFKLISCMDDVIDCIDEAFNDCLMYKISVFTSSAQKMTELIVLAIEKLEISINKLRDWKKNFSLIRENNRQIHHLENQTDEVLRIALGQLFDEEQDIRLIIKWKEIYETLEKAMDYCEDVGDILEGIILEYD